MIAKDRNGTKLFIGNSDESIALANVEIVERVNTLANNYEDKIVNLLHDMGSKEISFDIVFDPSDHTSLNEYAIMTLVDEHPYDLSKFEFGTIIKVIGIYETPRFVRVVLVEENKIYVLLDNTKRDGVTV